MGYSGSAIDITQIAKDSDVQTLLARVTAAVAKDSDVQTLLARVTAAVAKDSDVQTLLARVTATVALAATALSTAQWTNTRAAFLDLLSCTTAQEGTFSFASGISGAYSAYQTVIASLNAQNRFLSIQGFCDQANDTHTFQIATGAAASEVNIKTVTLKSSTNQNRQSFVTEIPLLIAAGTRISVRAKVTTASASTFDGNITSLQP